MATTPFWPNRPNWCGCCNSASINPSRRGYVSLLWVPNHDCAKGLHSGEIGKRLDTGQFSSVFPAQAGLWADGWQVGAKPPVRLAQGIPDFPFNFACHGEQGFL
jgi:hypothetical protein